MIEIDEEFKRLIPPLTTEEYDQLKENCLNEGIRDALVVWNNNGKLTLVDGHNRYQIAKEHNLEYKTKEKQFESRNDVIVWICNNQLGRRNLHELDRANLLESREEAEKEEARKRQLSKLNHSTVVPPKLAEREKGDTRDKMAKLVGVSHGQYDKLKRINKLATPHVKDMVRNGTLSVNQAYNSTFPKVLNPVKEATKEHEEYQEKLKSGVVDINEAKKDKTNQDILYSGFMVELYKVLRTVTGFGMMYTYKDIDKHTKKIPQQESEDLILKLDAVIGVLDYVRTEIERSNNERN